MTWWWPPNISKLGEKGWANIFTYQMAFSYFLFFLECQNYVYHFSPNLSVCVCVCVCVWGGCMGGCNFTPPPSWFSLNNSKTVKAVILEFCSIQCNILSETFMPNFVSITRPSLQILGKTQTLVFPISEFLVNPL